VETPNFRKPVGVLSSEPQRFIRKQIHDRYERGAISCIMNAAPGDAKKPVKRVKEVAVEPSLEIHTGRIFEFF
jgi:hypothetical protein